MEVIDRVGAYWPPYIKEWHRQHARFTTTARQSIGEIMCNVNKPAFFTETCVCRAVEQRLKEKGFGLLFFRFTKRAHLPDRARIQWAL